MKTHGPWDDATRTRYLLILALAERGERARLTVRTCVFAVRPLTWALRSLGSLLARVGVRTRVMPLVLLGGAALSLSEAVLYAAVHGGLWLLGDSVRVARERAALADRDLEARRVARELLAATWGQA